MEECRKQLQDKQVELDLKTEQEIERLKNEIQSMREDRSKLHSVTSSSASVTIYPPSTPSSDGVQSSEPSLTSSPDNSQRDEESKRMKDINDEKTKAIGPSESVTQEDGGNAPDTVNKVTGK